MAKGLSDSQIERIASEIAERMEEKGQMEGGDARQSRMILTTPWGVAFESGQIFEAQTTKGGMNYVLFLFQTPSWVYYCHGEKAKKVPKEKFLQLVEGGELNPIERHKADPDRISMAVLGLNAMAQGLSFNDYMKVIWNEGEGSQAP